MNIKILRIFLVLLIFVSCTKNIKDHSKNLIESTNVNSKVALSSADIPVHTMLYVGLFYSASSKELFINADIDWANGLVPSEEELSSYSIRFTIKGNKANTEVVQIALTTSSSGEYTTNVIGNSTNSPITVSAKVELLNGSTVINSANESMIISPFIDASSLPKDSTAIVTLNKEFDANIYTIQASNMAYLDGKPNNNVYFYAFYMPTLEQRYNLNQKSIFLGYTRISGSDFFPAIGGFTFDLPNDQYNPSNIRIFLSKKEYPESYFTNSLINVGYETYLIDNCVNDAVLYDVYCKGLNSTNGIFNNYSFPTSMNLSIGSMNRMLDYQIYIYKVRGFLW